MYSFINKNEYENHSIYCLSILFFVVEYIDCSVCYNQCHSLPINHSIKDKKRSHSRASTSTTSIMIGSNLLLVLFSFFFFSVCQLTMKKIYLYHFLFHYLGKIHSSINRTSLASKHDQ